MELHNINADVVDEVYKIASINLCPNVPGQIALGLMVNPPKPGDPSYSLYQQEKSSLIESLQRRARMITDAFNALEGVTCQETDGTIDFLFLLSLYFSLFAFTRKCRIIHE